MLKSFLIAALTLILVNTSVAQTAIADYNQGMKLQNTKKYTEAIVFFKKAIALDPRYKEAYYQAGWCSNENGNYTDALYYLQKAKELWPNQAKIYYELGYASEKTDKTDDAIDYYKTSISLFADYKLAYKALGDIYFDQKNYKKSLDFFLGFAEKESNITSSEFYYRKGYCENDLEKYDDAVVSLKKALELENDFTNAYTELGYSYYALGKYDEALTRLNKAISLKKNQLPVYYAGLCYVGLKQKSAAMKMYNDLKEMKSDNADKLKKRIDEM